MHCWKTVLSALEQLYCFLTSSLPRYRVLTEQQDKMIQDTALTLKRLSDTRWASRKLATDAVMQNMPAIIAALEIIIDDARSEPGAVADT